MKEGTYEGNQIVLVIAHGKAIEKILFRGFNIL
jgi:hypothetical protein